MSVVFDASKTAATVEEQKLRLEQYHVLKSRLGHLFTTNTQSGYGGSSTRSVEHLQSLWSRFGGHPKWQELLGPDQLSLLLSFDERLVFRTTSEDAVLPSGFVECVLSRLPCLTSCTLTNVEFACCHPELFTAPQLCATPFPQLRHLDLRRSTVRDSELVALVRIMPRLEMCDVRGCTSLTWRGIEEARQVAGAMGHPALQTRPASAEEKAAEHDWLLSLYGHHLNKAEGGLAALWREVHADERGNCYEGMLSQAQLSMLLHHDKRETFRIEGTFADNVGLLEGTVERVLSRLPRLQSLVLRKMRFSLQTGVISAVPNPFPALKELYLENLDIENRLVTELVSVLPKLELLSLKGCYRVSWRVMELARSTCGPQMRVLPETRDEKVAADNVMLDELWVNYETRESKEEYKRLRDEFSAVLRAMASDEKNALLGPWLLWKELGGTHCWRTHLRPSQLTLLLSREKTQRVVFSVDVDDRSSKTASAPATAPASVTTTTVTTTSSSGGSGATDASGWSVITDPASSGGHSLTFDAGEVRAYFSHALARLPELVLIELDGCPVWPFQWKLEEDHIESPFPQLRRLRLRNMTCHAKDLRDLVRHIPTLLKGSEDGPNNAISVDYAYVLNDDYSGSKLRQMCCGKVSVCHPDGTWHPIGEKP